MIDQRSQSQVLVCLAIAALTLVVYWQVQCNQFLLWDDRAYIVENPHVRTGLSLENAIWAFRTANVSYWHPLAWLSHMLDCELYGLNPRGHHLNALLLHTLNSLLLFVVLQKMTGALWKSALVAAIFSVHPLRIESVAWVSERKDVLGTFFWMTTLLAYIGYTRQKGRLHYLLVLFSFGLVLMTKATLVTLPFVLLLLDYWPLGRGGVRSSSTSLRRLLLEKLPLFLLAVTSGAVTLFTSGNVGALNPYGLPLKFQVGNALVSYVKYMAKMVWPSNLSFLYPHPLDTLPLWEPIVSLGVLAAVSILCLRQLRRRPYLAVGWFWYLGTLVPVIGFWQVGAQAMADRFTYVPHVGLLIGSIWLLSSLTSKWRPRVFFLSLASGLVIFLLSMSTYHQLRYWRDSTSLFSRALHVTSNNYLAHHLLGSVLLGEGRLEEALSQFSESHRIRPGFVPSLYNMGVIMSGSGRLDEAAEFYLKGLKIDPNDASIHNNLGNIYARQGKVKDAVESLTTALRIRPDFALAHNNLANLLLQEGEREKAIEHYNIALQIEPEFKEARYNLKRALGGETE